MAGRLYEISVTTDRKLQFHTQEQEPCSHNITSRSAWLMEPVNDSKVCKILNDTDCGYVSPLMFCFCS
jgi:hypothetical protein